MASFVILVVDDSPSFSRSLVRLLSSAGTIVETALSADEARVRIANQRPDLVFLDVFLKADSDGGSNELAFVDFRDVPTFRMSSEIGKARNVIADGIARYCRCTERSCSTCSRAEPIDKQDWQLFEECVKRAKVGARVA